MERVSLAKPIFDYVDTLVHPAAHCDALTAARHRAFIAPRLFGSFIALAAFPIYIALRGAPGALEVLILVWPILPILAAYFLSRSGNFEAANLLSALALTALGTAVAVATGGIASFATAWLVIVPLEAALSTSRRVIAIASALTFGALGLLLFLGAGDMLPVAQPSAQALPALAMLSAALYAAGLVLGAWMFMRAGTGLLKDQTDRYRLLAANMTDAMTRHDRNGAIVFVSPATEQLFGAPASELIGHGLFDRVHVADRPAFLTTLGDVAAFGRTRSVEFRVRRETATPVRGVQFISVEMRCQAVDLGSDASGRKDREVIAVMRDITEKKQQEQKIEDMQNELALANSARSKSLAVMSHELRTPLNAIIGFSQMLSNEDQIRLDDAQRKDYARLINESGTHLLSLVSAILDSSKLKNADFEIAPESFAPGPVIGSCCDLLALEMHAAGLDLALRLDPSLPELVADIRAFRQILINLLSNAVKFTDRNGRISVGAIANGSALILTIEDTGIGVRSEDLPRLGDPFFQAQAAHDRKHDGSGLGLSIVKGLVARHGGQLEIASNLGRGTRVRVRLPLDCRSAQPLDRAPKGTEHRIIERATGAVDNRVKKSA